jgi:hypothetical protein
LPDVHNALWASALSGLSGTALPWWWERLDQQDVYSLYRPLSRFVHNIPWTTGQLERAEITSTNSALRFVGLQSRGEQAWFWVFHNSAASKTRLDGRPLPQVNDVEIEIKGLKSGVWEINWFDTRRGVMVKSETLKTSGRLGSLLPPTFEGDVACHLKRR